MSTSRRARRDLRTAVDARLADLVASRWKLARVSALIVGWDEFHAPTHDSGDATALAPQHRRQRYSPHEGRRNQHENHGVVHAATSLWS